VQRPVCTPACATRPWTSGVISWNPRPLVASVSVPSAYRNPAMHSRPIGISIVTPSFRSVRTVEATMRSVLDQGYANLEYIVVDGAAGDGTDAVVEKYQSRLTYWCSEPDAGQYDAINKGFLHTTGEVLGWLNADDMLLPGALHVVGEIFRRFPQIDWLTTLKPGLWDADGYFLGTRETPGYSRAAFLDGLYLPGTRSRGYWIQQESTFWRRSLWEKAGARIPAEYSLAGDFALWAQFYRHAELIGCEYPIAGFRTIKGQRTEEVALYKQQAATALEALRRVLDWKESARTRLVYGWVADIGPLKRLVNKHAGYAGVRVGRSDSRTVGGEWRMTHHSFSP
jgi:glycosyltransferase involved in cell wall biosynthesis